MITSVPATAVQPAPDIQRYVERLLTDESWQTGEDDERRIYVHFAIETFIHAMTHGLDMERQYRRVLVILKVAADYEDEKQQVAGNHILRED